MATLRLLRNNIIYATHDEALAAIQEKAANSEDGELWIATYGTSPNAKSILAINRLDGLTIFDNDASSEYITHILDELDATVGTTEIEEGKHVAVQVIETDGVLTSLIVSENNIASASLLGTVNDTQSDETAFGYIAKEKSDREAAIQALTKADESENKKFVTSVSENEGIITVERGGITSGDKTIALTNNADGGIDFSVNADNATIVKHADNGTLSVTKEALTQYTGDKAINVSAVDAQSNEKTISLLIPNTEKVIKQDVNGLSSVIMLKSVTPSGENVREEYELQGINGQKLGTDTIKVYKDQTLKDAKFENQILTLTYILSDGTEKDVDVDTSSIIIETEVENGIQAVSHKLSIKLDTDGDDTGDGKFLSVGSNGLKLDGVTDAINNAIQSLDVSSITKQDSKQFISVTVSETDGKINLDGVSAEYGDYGTVSNGIADVVSTKTYIDGAVTDLNADLSEIDSKILTNVNGSDAVEVSGKENKAQTISLKLDETTKHASSSNPDNALTITANEGLYLSNVWDCGEY